jgi:hypothetical protein
MKLASLSVLLLCIGAAHAAAPAEPAAESCDQIRAQIQAHTGMPAKPNTALLAKVGENRKCRFTAAEAYRAAWGDKPLPKDDPRDRRAKHREHDDD